MGTIAVALPPIRVQYLCEFRPPEGQAGEVICSLVLWWQGPDLLWRSVWASGPSFAKAEADALTVTLSAWRKLGGGSP